MKNTTAIKLQKDSSKLTLLSFFPHIPPLLRPNSVVAYD